MKQLLGNVKGATGSMSRIYRHINSENGNQGPQFFMNNYINKKETIKETIKNIIINDIEVDNLIIGAGIGGTYMASRLLNLNQNEKTLIVDKLDNYGGLQTSSIIPGTDDFIDLGPVRFFPSIHPRVDYLRNKYELPVIEYLPDNTGQVYNLRGRIFTPANVFPDSDVLYNIRDDEKGINPFEILENNLKEFFPDFEKLADLEYRMELFKNIEYSKGVFKSLAQQNLSEENWQRIEDCLGYNDIFSVKGNFLVNAYDFLVNAYETLVLAGKYGTQYRFKNGYSSLTKKIAEKNNIKNITFSEFDKNTFNNYKHYALFNTAVLNVEFQPIKNMWKVVIGSVSVNSPEDISYIPETIKTIYTRVIYSTIPLNYLKYIHNFPKPYFNLCENSFVKFQVMRIFLKFETDWMTENGIAFGKTITSSEGGQLIHFADKVLMFYAFSTQCTKLYNFFPNNKQIQKDIISPNVENQPLIDECVSIIKSTYGINTISNVNGLAYASWISPVKFFSGRNLQALKDDTLYDQIDKIMCPYGINGNFYILENGASFNAGWNEGSIELADILLHNKFGQPLFGVELIK